MVSEVYGGIVLMGFIGFFGDSYCCCYCDCVGVVT